MILRETSRHGSSCSGIAEPAERHVLQPLALQDIPLQTPLKTFERPLAIVRELDTATSDTAVHRPQPP